MISSLREIDRLSWFNRASVVYLFLVVPLYWNFDAYDSTLWEKFLVAHIIVIRMAAGWVGVTWSGQERGSRLSLDIPILLYLALASISWLSAINPLKSGMEVVRILIGATIYFSVSRTYQQEYRGAWLGAASVSLAIVSVIGIAQYLGLYFLDWRSAGLPSSTFFYRNYAAMFVILVLPLAFAGFALSRSESLRSLHAISATLGTLFLVYTRTRGAWMGIGLSILVVVMVLLLAGEASSGWVAWRDALRSRTRALTVCGMILLCGILLPPARTSELQSLPMTKASAGQAFVSILARDSSGRTGAWLQSLGMIADHPIGGVGIGNWSAEFPRYAGLINRSGLQQDGALFGRPHNDYLWVLTEMGILGLSVFLWIFGGGMWLVWRISAGKADPEKLILATSLGAAVLAISIHAFFSFPRERMVSTVLPFLFLGWIVSIDSQSDRSAVGRHAVWRPSLLFVFVLISFSTTLNVARSFRSFFWADVYKTFEKYEEGLVAIDQAIEFGVPDYRIHELKTFLHYKMGNHDKALTASEQLIALHPYNPWSHHKVGLFQLELGDYESAKIAFAQAAKYGPGLGRIRRDLGQAYERLGMPDSAMIAYRSAMKTIGTDALLRTRLASLLADRGALEEATENITVAANRLKLTQVDRDIAVVGDVAMKAQAYEAAVLAYSRATVLVPDNTGYQSKLAAALEHGGDMAQAISVLKKLLDLVPKDDKEEIKGRIGDLESKPAGDG